MVGKNEKIGYLIAGKWFCKNCAMALEEG